MVLTEEQKTDMYPAATMETANQTIEESFYTNLPATRIDAPGGYPGGAQKVAKVRGDGNKIGPAIILKVMAGDKINLAVNSYWIGGTPNAPQSPLNDLISALSANVASVTGGKATSSELTSSGLSLNAVSGFLNNQTYTSGKPKAYVNWLLLDEQFKAVITNDGKNSGFEQVQESGSIYNHNKTNWELTKNGYLYIYVSNETPNIDVFFDNLQVTHIRGPLIEETHYYPFGLSMAGISSKALNFGNPENKKKFVGHEFDDDLGWNTYQFKFRTHDPQIGRFLQIDPLASNYVYNSTYAYAENDVIRAIDLEGLEKLVITNEKVSAFVAKVAIERIYRDGKLVNNNIKLNDQNGKPVSITKDVLRLQNNVKMNGTTKYEDQTNTILSNEKFIMDKGITQVSTVGKNTKDNQIEITERKKVVGLGDKFDKNGDTYINSEGFVSGKTTSTGSNLTALNGIVGQINELKEVGSNIDLNDFKITLTGGTGSKENLENLKTALGNLYEGATISVVENKNFKPIGNNKVNLNATITVVGQQ